MPSKKQRRRQQKLKRHEWEEVYVDEEGREVDPDEAEQLLQPAKAARAKSQPADRGRRAVEPPSWRRTLKRGALFFPLMLIVIFLVSGSEVSTAAKVIQTVTLMAFFLPFSYVMDSLVWRSYQRRLTKSAPAKKR
jgi:cytochrome c-type biogenesis protein CcmH/NrfG